MKRNKKQTNEQRNNGDTKRRLIIAGKISDNEYASFTSFLNQFYHDYLALNKQLKPFLHTDKANKRTNKQL